MQYKINIGSPSIIQVTGESRPYVDNYMGGYEEHSTLCECRRCGEATIFHIDPPRWEFNDLHCGFVNPEYRESIANLSSSLTIFRLLSNFQHFPNARILDCFAPDFVDDLGDAILQGNIQNFSKFADAAEMNQAILVKDKSFELTDNNKAIHALDSGLEYTLTPLLLAILCKQNEIALEMLKNTDLSSVAFQRYTIFEVLWLIKSSLITRLCTQSNAQQFCNAYTRLLSENIRFEGYSLLATCIDKLSKDAALELYINPAFQVFIADLKNEHVSGLLKILQSIYKAGVSVDQPINAKGDNLLIKALVDLKNEDYISFLLHNNADIFFKNTDGKTIFDYRPRLCVRLSKVGDIFQLQWKNSDCTSIFFGMTKPISKQLEQIQQHDPKLYSKLFQSEESESTNIVNNSITNTPKPILVTKAFRLSKSVMPTPELLAEQNLKQDQSTTALLTGNEGNRFRTKNSNGGCTIF